MPNETYSAKETEPQKAEEHSNVLICSSLSQDTEAISPPLQLLQTSACSMTLYPPQAVADAVLNDFAEMTLNH